MELASEHVQFSAELHKAVAQKFSDIQNEDTTPYTEYIKKFNTDQKRIFVDIISRLHSQDKNVKIPSSLCDMVKESNSNPLFKFISGVGGVGKSFVIKAITAYTKQVFNSQAALMAPTGIDSRVYY